MFKILFFSLIVRPIVLVLMGLNVKYRERLPEQGPALLIANHNSHLDTVVLMTLFPLRFLGQIRAVAAADYFLKNKWISWFSRECIGILPIARKKEDRGDKTQDPLEGIYQALDQNQVVVFFPEGSRGDPEKMNPFKFGISKLAERYSKVPIVPIYLQGLGKSLPKGEGLFVPYFCDVVIGESVFKATDETAADFVIRLQKTVEALGQEVRSHRWE